jgi:hypothetical protein
MSKHGSLSTRVQERTIRQKYCISLTPSHSPYFPSPVAPADSEHLFTSQQMDWGFNQFVPLVDVADPAKGLIHEGGVLRIRVEVQVRRDERLSWDSRKETGYVGLKNQGATCYMNSLLQCLYYLPFFRKVGLGERAGALGGEGTGWQTPAGYARGQ